MKASEHKDVMVSRGKKRKEKSDAWSQNIIHFNIDALTSL